MFRGLTLLDGDPPLAYGRLAMTVFVSQRRCNAQLRRPAQAGLGGQISQSSKPLPSWHWVGGKLTVDTTKLLFDGRQHYGHESKTFTEERCYEVPLRRIAGFQIKRGPSLARYLAVEIANGGLLHLRPTRLQETADRLEEALSWTERSSRRQPG